MTQPTVPFDFDRVLTNATQAAAGAVAPLAAELAMTREMSEQRAARVAELERALDERNTDNARLQQANDLLQQQIAALEAAGGDTANGPAAG